MGVFPRAGSEASDRPVDLLGAGTNRVDRVGDRDVEVLVTVEPDLGVVAEFGDQCLHPHGDVLEHERTRGVHDVDD